MNQETGFSNCLPTGRGLFTFETMEDILRAVDTIKGSKKNAVRPAR